MIYTTSLGLKSLRTKTGISQADIADKIGISRASYIALEQGKREPSLSEAQKLSDLFGVSLRELETGALPLYNKYKEMILAYVRMASSEKDGKIPKTKLAKLLYLADFAWFYNTFQSMSGMQYRRIKYGPVPDMYFRAIDELEEEGKISIDRSKDDVILISENRGSQKEKLNALSKEESALISDIAKKWKNKRTQEIVDFTHNQLPYKICVPDEIIPYELITQEDPEYVY
jgi:transcriptional regulator with XRE-family HTH domain